MKKVSKKSKTTQNSNTQKTIVILYVLIGLLIGAVVVLAGYTRTLWQQNNGFSAVRSLIIDAVEGLYEPTVIEPKERRQYILDASVSMPVFPKTQPFLYGYSPAGEADGLEEEITLTTNEILRAAANTLGGDQKSLFDNVPQLQRCSKIFVVRFQHGIDGQEGFDQFATKQLADGRVAYLYQNTECQDFYSSNMIDVEQQQAILKNIESY